MNLVCLHTLMQPFLTHIGTINYIKVLSFELSALFSGGVKSDCQIFVFKQVDIASLYRSILVCYGMF